MKKLILVSMLYQTTDLVRTIAPELEGKTVTYIPTAGIAEEVEGMVEKETSTLESLGLTVDVLEVSTSSQEEIVDSLKRNDVIFVGGGNTFFLLQELRRSGADQILIREVEKELGSDGRVLVRPSGTEPLVRIMVEASTQESCTQCAERIAAAYQEKGYLR